MCVDRDRHPAGRRRGRRAARWRRWWWWCSWWEAFDGPRGRRGGAAFHACGSAVDADGPPTDGGSSSTVAHGTAQYAHGTAQHAEHAAASRRDAQCWHGWHGRHDSAAGAKLPATERGIAAAAQSSATLAAQRHVAAAGCVSGCQCRVASGARLDPPIGSCANPWAGRASWRSRSPRGGRWTRGDAAFASSHARSSRFWPWLRRRARLGQQAGWRICHEAGAAAGPDRRGWWWSTGRQHAARPGRQPSRSAHDEAVVSESKPWRRWRLGWR
jgi:hypothetical protein